MGQRALHGATLSRYSGRMYFQEPVRFDSVLALLTEIRGFGAIGFGAIVSATGHLRGGQFPGTVHGRRGGAGCRDIGVCVQRDFFENRIADGVE